MSEKILLIDGHSILNRAFYGLPDLTTRKPMPAELHEQVPLMKEMLTAMGIKIVSKAGYEADDLLGTLAVRSEKEGMDVTILSGDRDLLQLATEKVMIRLPKTSRGKTTIENFHAAEVLEKYQVTPPQIIELKALMGDSADNIPGIPGVGEKTATKMIVEFGTIENAYVHLEEIKPNKARESLREHYDLAELSKALATINTESPLEYVYEEARLGNLYTPEAYQLCKQLEFKNLLSRFDVSAPANKVEDGFKIITSKSEAEKVFVQAEEASTIGAVIFKDLENVLPLFADQAGLGGIGLCFSKEESYCIKVEKDITGEWLLKKLADVA